MLSVRVVTVDHYLSKPIGELYGNGEGNAVREWQEPVIRIFGATADGIKTCVHVHGAYPYMFVPYKGGDNPGRDALLLGAALDEALKTSLNPKVFRYVHKVILISGIPLYGYHSKHRKFFKIFFFNPYHIRKASELLLSGAILGQKFQPHEAHIPYALQFLMDYNIYGMSFATFSKVKHRRNLEKPDCMNGVKEEDIFGSKVKKMTCCDFEVDALASDIVNRMEQKVTEAYPGLRAIWEDEREMRRRQNRPSPITIPQSQSRHQAPEACPIELMFRDRLAQKLGLISAREAEATAGGKELGHIYPAEVSEDENILEASAVDEELEVLGEREVCDVSSLIDERIVSEIAGTREKFAGSESEEDGVEADSVLGRNQREEEGAEFENEEGVDMTQPLDSDDSDVCDAEGNRHEPGRRSSGSDEEAFWRSMAEKIWQLDGAEESSSESDAEAVPSGSDGTLECSSTWSTNIMSILSEDSGCPTPSTVCQTPRTFWSNYSPNWQPHDQYDCDWNRTGEQVPDLATKTAPDNFCDFPAAPKDLSSGEPCLDFFDPNDAQYFSSSAVTPLCDLASTASPPYTAGTPPSDLGASDVPPASFRETPGPSPSEERPSFDNRAAVGWKPDSERQKFLQVLRSFAGSNVPSDDQCCHLTLKQYIKDCREIVSVDFKNLCNQEMIIIEYKSRNKKSVQNKYLIKPLEKFLENWNSAERRANGGLGKNGDAGKVGEGRNLRSVINVVGSKFGGDASRVQSVRNRLTVKSMEILPEEGRGRSRHYNVNGNVISEGKIKMKLIKSRREKLKENVMKERLKSERMERCQKSGVRSEREGRKDRGRQDKCKGSNKRRGGTGKRTEWKSFTELDSKLISDINSSFEEYFESLVKRKNLLSKRKKEMIEDESEDEDGDSDDDNDREEQEEGKEEEKEEEEEEEELVVEEHREESSEDEKECAPPGAESVAVGKVRSSCRTDPVKFVTRFLSAFSRMPDVPPFSVTISLGNCKTSMPVEMNFQPAILASRKEVKYYSKKRRSKIRFENVDGPADGSSSSESESEDSKEKSRRQKKRKKEAYYKPLKVVVYGSPCMKDVVAKRRKMSEEKKDNKAESSEAVGRKRFSSGDYSGVCRKKTECRALCSGEKAKSSCENESIVKGNKRLADLEGFSQDVGSHRWVNVFPESNQEPDFIGDSDEERKRQRSDSVRSTHKWRRKTSKLPLKRIPQADTEAFTSSDDEDSRTVPEKLAQPFERVAPPTTVPQTKETCYPQMDKMYVSSFTEVTQNPNLASSPQIHSPSPQSLPPATDAFQASDSLPPVTRTLHTLSPEPYVESSPLTLSGNPLFASHTDCPQSDSVQPAEDTGRKHFLSGSTSRSSELWSGYDERGGSDGQRVTGEQVLEANTIVPGQRPVRKKEAMESMYHYGVVESDENAPFYSDPRDVTKPMEVGPRVLTIENRSIGALKTFKSSLDIVGTEERRNRLLAGQKMERWRLVEDKDTIIVPLMRPPPPGTVLQRVDSKGKPGEKEREQKKAKVKVIEHVSSGEEGDSCEEMELSLTLEESESGYSGAEECLWKSRFRERKRVLPGRKETGMKINLEKEPSSEGKGERKFSMAEKLEPILEEAELCAPTPEPNLKIVTPPQQSKEKSEISFQIRGVTLENTFGFSHSVENLQNIKASAAHQYMDMLVVELHVQTRKDFCPDPDHDPIRALFYAIAFDSPTRGRETGVIVVGDRVLTNTDAFGLRIHHVPTEMALIITLLGFVREWDPEILAGYEIEMHSWGYLVQRASVLEMNLILLLGRVVTDDLPVKTSGDLYKERDDAEDIPRSVKHLRVSGRIVLDIWRVLRHEVALTSYSFENVMYHLAHERHPLRSYESLSRYWDHPTHPSRQVVVDHYATRVLGVIRILDQLDFIARTSELSRLFGIQFLEVLSRGSQFRVESMMLRLAKPLNYIPASPSVAQRAAMRAPASLPLILEPESLFYTDPLVVLDFQSLYPSMIIAYNYCFSTCLGRVDKLGGREPFEFGCTQLQIAPEELKSLENELTISPAGVAFVKPSVRRGILPAMLAEILETRLMVKKSMKENKDDKLLQKVLFSRQLGLKLIANVTYGYTAANFSGRMPCIEVGDSVVSKGRETLHRAIRLVQSTKKWRARVVYGDTDSIFVLTPGRSREEAFRIGAEIAEAVTQDNPRPVKLKLEKVYQPSILQTKKRYLGYMYESPEQEKPVFEAKGIETVRRDGCPAMGKVLEKALRILFDTRDVSLVKKYAVRQFAKLFEGRVNLQDLIFAKEYRGRKGYRAGACVPALHLAKQWTQHDKRAEPRVKERVPYVIVSGPPGVPLIRLVRSPKDLLSDPSLRINAVYYITKALIPAMQRCFSLLGADVMSWYASMPRKFHRNYKSNLSEGRKRTTISQYFATKQCIICNQIANDPLCSKCDRQPQVSVVCLTEKIRFWERRYEGIVQICRSCCGRPTEIDCVSLDCPVLFRRVQAIRDLEQAPVFREILARHL